MLSDWVRGHGFKNVLRGDVNNMTTMSEHSSLLSLADLNIFLVSRAGTKQRRIPKNFPPPYSSTGIATLLIGSTQQCQPIK